MVCLSLPPHPLQDFKKPGSMGEQYFLGLEHIFKGSGNPSYPGECMPWSRVHAPDTWCPLLATENDVQRH